MKHDLPDLPGVYFFKDHQGAILYIGKAKSLRDRVRSYFNKSDDWKIAALLEEHASIEHIVTHTEIEASLLEAQLIEKYQPKYNTLLKSGNPFLYIVHTDDHQLELVRTKELKGRYFGPFLQKRQARGAYDYLMRTFSLYRCNRTIAHGCLDFHIGRCSGACKPDFDEAGYLTRLQLATQALQGDSEAFLHTIAHEIARYTEQLAFEKARRLQQYREDLDTIFATLKAKFTDRKYTFEVARAATQKVALPEADYVEAAGALQRLLQLAELPHSIDCFDISHFQSSYIVGSSVRFTDGKPAKNKFRRFKIRTLAIQDDYAALQEIIMRRYRDSKELPDIVLIDGGKGQLSAARAVVPAHVPVIALAKREERIYGSGLSGQGVKLDLQTAMGRLLIALRDYAHHFALSYHQLLRKKGVSQ